VLLPTPPPVCANATPLKAMSAIERGKAILFMRCLL
jgi:hypothetical protein